VTPRLSVCGDPYRGVDSHSPIADDWARPVHGPRILERKAQCRPLGFIEAIHMRAVDGMFYQRFLSYIKTGFCGAYEPSRTKEAAMNFQLQNVSVKSCALTAMVKPSFAQLETVSVIRLVSPCPRSLSLDSLLRSRTPSIRASQEQQAGIRASLWSPLAKRR
jgi:hypothetical protein